MLSRFGKVSLKLLRALFFVVDLFLGLLYLLNGLRVLILSAYSSHDLVPDDRLLHVEEVWFLRNLLLAAEILNVCFGAVLILQDRVLGLLVVFREICLGLNRCQ
jgi:hypothetical protein